ncbi:MAG: carbohydrate kinase family protein, partial [Candidatus Heimdallarchaeota archaeon]
WMKYEEYLPLIDILKVDDAELKGLTGSTTMKEATARALSFGIKFLIITRAHKGAIIYHKTKRYDISAVPTAIVDETGAGDTFITAFLIEYLRTKDCHYSAMIAASTAAFKISNSGPIPNYSRTDILAKLQTIYPNFIEQ